MKLSTDRIRTTHVGSLPRPQAVVDLLYAKEAGEAIDAAAYDATMRDAVRACVERQVATGIDSVSDGETSKVGYSTYIQERLSGFGGDNERKISLDLVDYPEYRRKMAVLAGPQRFRRASCIGPVAVVHREPLQADIANLTAAVARTGAAEAFMNAASPGVVTAFQPNAYYPNHETYVAAVADAMQEEYEQIVAAGFVLQIDCPDLAMARHTGFQDLTEREFLARCEVGVEALNHALRNVPPEAVRIHICWGNYEGPHDHDIPLEKILPIVLRVRAAGIQFEAANPRHEHEWAVWRDAAIPDEKVLIPGCLDSCSNYVEHPELIAQRLERYAGIVGRERVLAGTDCGFGTFAGTGKVDPEIAYKKLAALVEGAALASRRLFGV